MINTKITVLTLSILTIFTASTLIFNLNTLDTISLLNTLSSLALSIIAIYGVDSWKKQQSWSRAAKAAEDISNIFYKMKNIFDDLFSDYDEEIIKNFSEENINKMHTKIILTKKSIQINKDITLDIKSKKYEFKIILGDDAEKICEELLSKLEDIVMHCNIFERELSNFRTNSHVFDDENILNLTPKELRKQLKDEISSSKETMKECFMFVCDKNDPQIMESIIAIESRIIAIQEKYIVK